jgi:MFS family permease
MEQKKKMGGKFWLALTIFSLMGQVAWVIENMYLNVFIYDKFSASPDDIASMVAASAITATLTTVFMGALSDRIGKRRLLICGGYILWGLSIFSFVLVDQFVSAAVLGVTLTILLDCVMTFFGSTANDAAFNAWLTDSTDFSNRGKAEGINAMMPLVAVLAVFGGFMFLNSENQYYWTIIFSIIGVLTLVIGVAGFFLIKEPKMEKAEMGYFNSILYGFKPSTVKMTPVLYIALAAFIVFNISIQIFMPYLIIYYEKSLQMDNYVLIMAPAIVLASVVTALWGKLYDKKGFTFSGVLSLAMLIAGYVILFFTRTMVPVFIGSLLMMSGYLSGMAVFGALIRDNTPKGKAGCLQGIRIFSQVLVPGIVGPFIGSAVLKSAETIVNSDGTESFLPNANIFLAAAIAAIPVFVVFFVLKNRRLRIENSESDGEKGAE